MFCRLSTLFRYLTLVRQADMQNLSESQHQDLEARRRALMTPVEWV